MKIFINKWELKDQNNNKRGEDRLLANCAQALSSQYIVESWPPCNINSDQDIGIAWLNLVEKDLNQFQQYNLKYILTYCNDINDEKIQLAKKYNIIPITGQKTLIQPYMSHARKQELNIWQNAINQNKAHYLPFPHTNNIISTNNFDKKDFIIPTRYIYRRKESEYIFLANTVIDLLTYSPGGIQDTGKIYFPCDTLTDKNLLCVNGQKLLDNNRLIFLDSVNYSIMLDLLSKSKMAFGFSPHGSSQYEAIANGCLPAIWLDSIFYNDYVNFFGNNPLMTKHLEARQWTIKPIHTIFNTLLTNQSIYTQLLERYKVTLLEHSYQSFIDQFKNIQKQIGIHNG